MREATTTPHSADIDAYLPALTTDPRVTLTIVDDTGDLDPCGECPEDPHGVGDDRYALIGPGVFLIEDHRTYIEHTGPRKGQRVTRIYRSTACSSECTQTALAGLLETSRPRDIRVTLHLGAMYPEEA